MKLDEAIKIVAWERIHIYRYLRRIRMAKGKNRAGQDVPKAFLAYQRKLRNALSALLREVS